MNERLHDMMMEATKDMPQCYYWPGEYVEKFAELIIAECVKVCEEQAENAAVQKKSTFLTDEGRQLYSGVWGGAKGCSGAIMNHFGVANE